MINHWNHQLKGDLFPLRTQRVNKGQLSVIGLNEVLRSTYFNQVWISNTQVLNLIRINSSSPIYFHSELLGLIRLIGLFHCKLIFIDKNNSQNMAAAK